MSNITSLESFRNRKVDELKDEKVDVLEHLNPPKGNFLIQSVQHQLDYMHHNAMASFSELAKDKQHDFVNLLDFTRSIFRNVFFSMERVALVACRNVHYYDEDNAKKDCDASILVGISRIEQMIKRVDSGDPWDDSDHDLLIELRLTSSSSNPSTGSNDTYNVPFEEIDFSKIATLTYQTKAIIRNLLELSSNCGGDTFIANGGKILMAQLPYSPAKQCLIIVQASNHLAYRVPD